MPNCIKCGAALPSVAAFCPACGKKQVSAVPRPRSRRTRPSGTGSVYRRGKTWECAYVHGYVVQEDGKVKAIRSVKGGFPTKKAALEYLPTLTQEPPRKIPTLQDLYSIFTHSRSYEEIVRKDKYTIAWNKVKRLWFRRIDRITSFDLQDTMDSVAETYDTCKDIKNLFSKLYQLAMRDQFVSLNLSKFLELPPAKAEERKPFTADEVKLLWKDYLAGNWWTGYALLMIYTGMMPGELLGARKDEIHWTEKQIIGAGIKTEERKQTPIVLADFLLPVLEDLCTHTPGEKLISINKDNFYDTFYATLARAGTRRLTPYSCRHTAATTLALENVPPSVIQKVMRHAKFSTTEKYIHVSVDPMLEAVNKLPQSSREGKENCSA